MNLQVFLADCGWPHKTQRHRGLSLYNAFSADVKIDRVGPLM
jgi:hypothetical protein